MIADPNRLGVLIEQWQPNTEVMIDAVDSAELFLLEGSFQEGKDYFRTYSWLRLPVNTIAIAHTGEIGAKVWLKTGYLLVSAPTN